ncbi:cytochrome c peroxidase [uncultured Maritalea sp.]|jgi:cytochrome c peroxidase|uniref:cytochrome-c peroxidase n=1 Tax=uncultured Maritalea sp. TaxID=757249 RepID=UPI002626C70F|nr:cytochrome c peroxidase [uncultured Maritalea sp.]
MKTIGTALISALLVGTSFSQNLAFEPANYANADQHEIDVGRFLFYDPILSGNKTVSCSTCHHSKFGTSDGVALGLGDGGKGLGPARVVDPNNLPEKRVPRNSPALFNLGADEFVSLFHDGRLEKDTSRPSGIRSPLEDEMIVGFDSVLSAQAMFPVLSPDEMAGHYSENEVSQAVRLGRLTGDGGAWDLIAERVRSISEYRDLFEPVLPAGKKIGFTDIANAIAAFIAFEWRANESPFDHYLRDAKPLSANAISGMDLFYGKSNCSSCHSGLFQTDHDYHAIAMPQIGPGKGARFESHARDTGRMHTTGRASDIYKFRTPSLRNVALTAPYGHAGAYETLEQVVRHHLDPVASLQAYRLKVDLPALDSATDLRIMDDPMEVDVIARANELAPQTLSDTEIEDLLAFLDSLTDPISSIGRLGVPDRVPSGLLFDQ